ncbi:MAG: acetylglutamate kinase [Alphaproteobacteria bacterium]|nr:acetylglutamate kinase [Alphaproteobacteria bacterium]
MKSEDITLNQISDMMEWIARYDGRTIVIKIGGNSIAEDKDFLSNIAKQIAFLRANNARVVLVHGGGPQIDAALECANVPSKKGADGRRITSSDAMKIIAEVMSYISKEIGLALIDAGCKGLMVAALKPRFFVSSKPLFDEHEDNRAGTPDSVDVEALDLALEENRVVVLNSAGMGVDGKLHNVNADDYAMAVAIALKADRLLLVSNSEVLDAEGNRISVITPSKMAELIADGTINGGMIPKIESAVSALKNGVGGVAIINGHPKGALLGELLLKEGFGTLVSEEPSCASARTTITGLRLSRGL